MDNKKIGDFISNLRRSKNLTQKDLADRLGVTDKAVSKWERGAGYPDISFLRPLADILGTSVNELLEGEALDSKSDRADNNLENALDYADKIISMKENKFGKILTILLEVSFLIAVCTSMIVNVAVNHRLSWSILVIDGCLMGALLLFPPLVLKKRGILISLQLITVFLLPFLAVIELVVSGSLKASGWFWGIGVPVSLSWLFIIWIIIFLFTKTKINFWYCIGISFLLCIPGQIITNYVVDLFTDFTEPASSRFISNTTSVVALLFLSVIFFIIGFNKKKTKEE